MFIMYKFLMVSCLLASCCCSPIDFESWLRDLEWRIRGRGCADRLAGWLACAGAEPDALAPHPRDCRFFFYCSKAGIPPACRPCPDGLYFNSELQVCDWPNQANCTARPPPLVLPEITSLWPEADSTPSPPRVSSTDSPRTAPSTTEEYTIPTFVPSSTVPPA